MDSATILLKNNKSYGIIILCQANARVQIFDNDKDYKIFESMVADPISPQKLREPIKNLII